MGNEFADGGDIDGDGYDDLAVVQKTNGRGPTLVYYGPIETSATLGAEDADVTITTALAMNMDPGDDIAVGELDQGSLGAELALEAHRLKYGEVEGGVAIFLEAPQGGVLFEEADILLYGDDPDQVHDGFGYDLYLYEDEDPSGSALTIRSARSTNVHLFALD